MKDKMCNAPMMWYDVNPTIVPLPSTALSSATLTVTGVMRVMDRLEDEAYTNNQKEKAMYDKASETARYLERRLSDTYHTTLRVLEREFGLRDDVSPKSSKEIVERINSGMYTLPTEDVDGDFYCAFKSIRWRDPSKKEDYAGYEVASAKLDKARKATMDQIQVMPSEVALKALQEFEATPTTAYH